MLLRVYVQNLQLQIRCITKNQQITCEDYIKIQLICTINIPDYIRTNMTIDYTTRTKVSMK